MFAIYRVQVYIRMYRNISRTEHIIIFRMQTNCSNSPSLGDNIYDEVCVYECECIYVGSLCVSLCSPCVLQSYDEFL